MSDDPKIDFYLRYRDRIEEWAALRASARVLLHRALLDAAKQLASERDGVIIVTPSRRGPTWVQLSVTCAPLPEVYVEWSWDERTLLEPDHWRSWVTLQVVLPRSPRPGLWQAVSDSIPPHMRRDHGLSRPGRDRWPWWGPLTPMPGPLDPLAYAQDCSRRAVHAWTDLRPVVISAVENLEGN